MYKNITNEEREKMREMIEQGTPYRDVAEAFGIPTTSVYAIMTRDLSKNTYANRLYKDKYKIIIEHTRTGESETFKNVREIVLKYPEQRDMQMKISRVWNNHRKQVTLRNERCNVYFELVEK